MSASQFDSDMRRATGEYPSDRVVTRDWWLQLAVGALGALVGTMLMMLLL